MSLGVIISLGGRGMSLGVESCHVGVEACHLGSNHVTWGRGMSLGVEANGRHKGVSEHR